MLVKLLLTGGIAMLLGALIALAVLPDATKVLLDNPKPLTTGIADVGGPFQLTNHLGKRVSDIDFHGKYLIVYFGFTYCPNICPAGLQTISAVLDGLGGRAHKFTPLFITLDPERDTSRKLALYLSSFHARFIGLTGTAHEIASMAKAYHVFFRKVEDPSLSSYTIDHTSYIYIMDPHGKYVAHYQHAAPVGTILNSLRALR